MARKYIATFVFSADSDIKAKFLLEYMGETFANETPDVGLEIGHVKHVDETVKERPVLTDVGVVRAEDYDGEVKPFVD